ncbi:MAG: M28 family peptidase [Polyangiaceae bacterium]|nr:M28 family peptidase [Polyangiaceae bacterium]
MAPRVHTRPFWAGPLALALGATLSLWLPRTAPAGTGRVEGFSTQRVLAHLKVIAQEPHPVGSPAHRAVRQYILRELGRLGVEVTEQRSTLATHRFGQTAGVTVHNVVARIAGRDPTLGAVLLDAHYDSAPTSPGASDDGVWVAALLETARVLASAPRLRRDVFLLFSDAEELGLFGARAFIREHPAAARVRLVLNYEARGTRGPVLMYETSPHNGGLVRAFGRAATSAHANSLFSTLSRLLPNGSNASEYQQAGRQVLGFAFAEGMEHYHRYTDTPQHLALATVADVGPHTLGLVRYFADQARLPEPRPDAVYFDIGGRWLVVYAPGWAAAFGSLCLAGWIAIAVGARRARRISGRGLLGGLWIQAGVVVFALLIPTAVAIGSLALVDLFCSVERSPWFGLGSLLILAGVYLSWTARALATRSAREVALGGMLIAAIIAAVLGWLAPAASASWQWPLAPALLAWGIETRLAERSRSVAFWAITASIAAAAYFLTPVVVSALKLAGPSMLLFPVAIGTSHAAAVLPSFGPEPSPWRRGAGAALVVSGVLLVASLIAWDTLRGPTTRTNSIVYAEDATALSARYFTYDSASDPWVARLIPPQAEAEPQLAFRRDPRPLRWARAELIPLPAPELRVRTVRADNQSRTMELRYRSRSGARCMELWQTAGPEVEDVAVNAKPVPRLVRFSADVDERGFKLLTGDRSPRGYHLTYCAMAEEPLELTLRVAGPRPARMRLLEEIDSLPAAATDILSARPPEVGTTGFWTISDVTLVSRVVVL